jgi:hypothetical protein
LEEAMRLLLALGALAVAMAMTVPASAQGYFDRVYRGASPDPSDQRFDGREADRGTVVRRPRRDRDDDPPASIDTRRGSGNARDQGSEDCDARQASVRCGR